MIPVYRKIKISSKYLYFNILLFQTVGSSYDFQCIYYIEWNQVGPVEQYVIGIELRIVHKILLEFNKVLINE